MRLSGRWGLIAPWAAFVAAALAYGAYWLALRDAVLTQIERAQTQAEAAGAELRVGAVRVEGFPLRLTARLTDIALAPAGGALRLSTGQAALNVNLSNPRHVILAVNAPLLLQREGRAPLSFEAAAAALSLRTNAEGLARVSLDVQGLRVDGVPRAERLTLHLRPDVRDGARWQVALTGAGLRPPAERFPILSEGVDRLAIAASLDRVEVPAFADPLRAWAASQKPASIEGLDASLLGFAVTGTGALRLDSTLRPEGGLRLAAEKPGSRFDLDIAARDGAVTANGAPQAAIDPLY